MRRTSRRPLNRRREALGLVGRPVVRALWVARAWVGPDPLTHGQAARAGAHRVTWGHPRRALVQGVRHITWEALGQGVLHVTWEARVQGVRHVTWEVHPRSEREVGAPRDV